MRKHIVDNGIRLIKYWLEVSNKEQKRGFEARIDDRMRQWKLSAMDLPSRERWYDYSRARDQMLEATDTDFAPWHIVRSDDKKRARLNILSHFLGLIPYEAPPAKKIKLLNRDKKHAYDDEATMKDRRWIKEKFLNLTSDRGARWKSQTAGKPSAMPASLSLPSASFSPGSSMAAPFSCRWPSASLSGTCWKP